MVLPSAAGRPFCRDRLEEKLGRRSFTSRGTTEEQSTSMQLRRNNDDARADALRPFSIFASADPSASLQAELPPIANSAGSRG